MLSSLSRGYGSWTGDVGVHMPGPQDASLPHVDHLHKHGITVTPRSRGSQAVVPVAEDGQLNIPKTFATRKGALMLFTAPEAMPKEPAKTPRPHSKRKRQHHKGVVDLSLKLKTLERLSLSVLQFGDKLYDKDTSSISDKENKMMLNFLHDMDQEYDDMDLHSQPGGDYKFYLRDLKRRASCRGHGLGDTNPLRARSAELQEILDDLEQAWPRLSQSHRRDSTLTGSLSGHDNSFLYPESPAPSTLSARTHSRGKVLSCKKLTASLKSLTSLGRPTSTEPDARSIVSDGFVASTNFHFGDPKRSRSAMWVSETSSPAPLHLHQPSYSRPQTSQPRSKSAMEQHKLVPSPEPSEFGASSVGIKRGRGLWVDVENQGDMSYTISDDGHSMVSAGADSDFLRSGASDRGHGQGHGSMTPVKEERMGTPTRGDRDAMLAEAASVLSSLVEEEDIDLPTVPERDDYEPSGADSETVEVPSENVLDDALPNDDETDASRWPGLTETEEQSDLEGRRSRVSSRSKTPKLKSDIGDGSIDNLAQPLQPPYTGPMTREARSTSPMNVGGEEEYKATQEGVVPYPQSRATSTDPDEAQMMYAGGSSNTTPVPRSDTPAAFSGHADGEVSQALSDVDQGRTSSALDTASVSFADKDGRQDPDTLVSMFGRQDANDLVDRALSPTVSQTIKSSLPLPPSPSPSPTAGDRSTITPIPPSPTPVASLVGVPSADRKVIDILALDDGKREDEEQDRSPIQSPGPKRRAMKEEPKTAKFDPEALVGEGAEEVESKEEEEGKESAEISERVKQEMEEREQRMIKQKEEEAEKLAEEAKKREEEESKKQAIEDKRKAAEERMRLRAEEVARKKEEDKLLKEQNPPPVEDEAVKKGTKGKKGKGKGDKQGSATADKKYVNALDIMSMQKDDESKDGKGMDALSKLKAGNKDVDMPMDKIQEFMNAQAPKVNVEPEKKEVHLTDHMKEMFGRRSDSQAQEELEEGIAKMRSAVDDALSGSVLQEDSVEGLSAEEFAAAQEALQEKLKSAQEQMLDAVAPPKAPPKKSPRAKSEEKKGSPTRKKKGGAIQNEKTDLAAEREAKKEQQRLEKQKRLEEVKELQQKIASKEEQRKAKEKEAKRKAEELQEHMDSIRQEEEELERAEEDAREQLAAVRKVQREEREARRKADLEKKKQEAIEKREKEKAMIEQARLKEQEMLDRIADSEMARRLREEDEAKREEEEQEAQERYEAEMKEAQRLAEEEEEKLRELERQAEEEAFARIIEEKEAAEEKRLQLEREAYRIREEEERQRLEMLEEERRLEEERLKHEEKEEARREQERERLRELQRLEEEARGKMRAELEKRRAWAMRRREFNLEQRSNLDTIRQSQGMTDPWTFSYHVRWPKESYHRPMGQAPKKQPGGRRPKPKPSAQQGSSGTQSAVDVAGLP